MSHQSANFDELHSVISQLNKQLEYYMQHSRLLQDILKNAHQGIIVYDCDLRIQIWNSFMENITGIPADMIIGKLPTDLIPFLRENHIIEKLTNLLHTGEPFQFEFPFKTKTKEGIAIDTSSPIYNNQNQLIGILAFVSDVTDQRAREQELINSEKHFHSLYDNLTDAVFYINAPNGSVISANQTAIDIYGYSNNELFNMPISMLDYEDDENKVKHRILQMQQNGQINFESQHITKDGRIIPVEVRAKMISDKTLISVVRNITERVKNEEEIRQKSEEVLFRKRLLEQVIDTIPSPIFVKDLHLKYTLVNSAFATLIAGKPKDEVIGKTVFEINLPGKIAEKSNSTDLSIIQDKLEIIVYEFATIFADGSEHDAIFYKTPLKNNDNKITGIVGVMLDITERKKAEKWIDIQNRKLISLNKDKDRFLQILAHDLKNPFNALLGLSDLLMRKVDTMHKDRLQELANILYSTSNHAYHLLDDLLMWANAQAGKLKVEPQSFVINEICEEIIQVLQQNTKNIKLHLVANMRFIVCADINMVKTIIRNLVSNAIKFSHNNSHIYISIQSDEENTQIDVEDMGVGMTEEMQQKLWKINSAFTTIGTNDEKGTGLGLLLCKDFVDKHNGKIWVKSEIGKGTTFSFTLPHSNNQCTEGQ